MLCGTLDQWDIALDLFFSYSFLATMRQIIYTHADLTLPLSFALTPTTYLLKQTREMRNAVIHSLQWFHAHDQLQGSICLSSIILSHSLTDTLPRSLNQVSQVPYAFVQQDWNPMRFLHCLMPAQLMLQAFTPVKPICSTSPLHINACLHKPYRDLTFSVCHTFVKFEWNQ